MTSRAATACDINKRLVCLALTAAESFRHALQSELSIRRELVAVSQAPGLGFEADSDAKSGAECQVPTAQAERDDLVSKA
jgi:hypothetical protein